MEPYPFLFEPNRHEKLWGSEEWLVSSHPSSPSIIANGFLKGRSLEEVAAERGRALMGADAPQRDRFPLLFKVIDAHDRLSVQVHPNAAAAANGDEEKTEMWYALEHAAQVCVGFKPGISRGDVARAIKDGTVEDILSKTEIERGCALFIPAGMVHSILAGSLLYEVQQSSDTTYRMYDWGRVGQDGRPRELHVDQSLASINCSLPPPKPASSIECGFFRFSQWRISEPRTVLADERTFRVLHAAEGSARIAWRNGSITLGQGRSTLIPANLAIEVAPTCSSVILATELGLRA